MRVLSSAATVKVKIARSTSVRAALIGLPASCAMVCANSSLRSVMFSATRRSTRCRSNAGKPPRGAESFDCGCNGRFRVFAPALKHTSYNAAVVGRSNLNCVAFLDPFTIEKKSMRATGVAVIWAMAEFLSSPGSKQKIIDFLQEAKCDVGDN